MSIFLLWQEFSHWSSWSPGGKYSTNHNLPMRQNNILLFFSNKKCIELERMRFLNKAFDNVHIINPKRLGGGDFKTSPLLYFSQGCTNRQIEIKAKKLFGLKKAYFWGTLIQAVEVKLLRFFSTEYSSYEKIFTPWKISLLTSLLVRHSLNPPPPPFSFFWQKAQPF